MSRKAVPDQTEVSVLKKSRRRCCLCFWLDGIDEVVKGQIAHLDRDPSNAEEDNLVFLCHNHHDEYDGRTSTSKGLKEDEVREWRDELNREMEWRFRKEKTGALVLFFDDARHCFVVNEACKMMRVSVRNEGSMTVKNVVVKITDVTAIAGVVDDSIRQLIGLRLGVAVDPNGDYRHPYEPPDSSVILHPGDEATYDLLRHQAHPANSRFFHSGYYHDPQIDRIVQKPRLSFKDACYRITLSVQGDNLTPANIVFEFSTSETEYYFREVE